jgi:EmrB/QacA subfamily drug resistance transporter
MDAETPEPYRAAPLSPSDIRSVFLGLMLAMLLSALDQTIVATAMPTIGRDLGGLDQLPWVVTAYLLASTAVTPLYGKFSDMHGRRVTLLIAITIFVVGSIACALAPTMLALILARGLQGLGGGGLIALSQTIVADMVTPRERGRYQVYFAAAFSVASLAGPVLGGFFAQNLHWSLIFWINLPLGIVAFLLTNDRLKKLPQVGRSHRLDVLGAVLLVGANTSLMLMLNWGGADHAWNSAPILLLGAASAALWAAFLARMLAASEPLIPLQLLADRVIGFATLASAFGMGTYIGLAIFVPIYFEVALGMSARQSGFALTPLMIGIVIGSTLSGRLMASVEHYKRAPIAGVSVAILSIGAVALESASLPLWLLLVLLFCASLGLGTVMPVATVAVQNAAPAGHLGTATAAMNFSRQLFGAIVVAIYGAIVLSGHEAGGGLTLETLSTRGANPELAATFRYVFMAATAGLVASLAFFALMEERPFRDRPRD